ncbi:hypothetical protein ACFQ71_42375 [Streptomyces sp. NPDC056534]|uniref:hypothetical protein n=1 Tax=Streptomyces sp. NPDC056534 TaxID=3345857 RepID=UPI0036999BF8
MKTIESARPFGLLENDESDVSADENDPFYPLFGRFPLGLSRGFVELDKSNPGNMETRPFGLQQAKLPQYIEKVDMTEFAYDKDRQVLAGRQPWDPDGPNPFIPNTWTVNPGHKGTLSPTVAVDSDQFSYDEYRQDYEDM